MCLALRAAFAVQIGSPADLSRVPRMRIPAAAASDATTLYQFAGMARSSSRWPQPPQLGLFAIC